VSFFPKLLEFMHKVCFSVLFKLSHFFAILSRIAFFAYRTVDSNVLWLLHIHFFLRGVIAALYAYHFHVQLLFAKPIDLANIVQKLVLVGGVLAEIEADKAIEAAIKRFLTCFTAFMKFLLVNL